MGEQIYFKDSKVPMFHSCGGEMMGHYKMIHEDGESYPILPAEFYFCNLCGAMMKFIKGFSDE